jgi:hypothetical protein
MPELVKQAEDMTAEELSEHLADDHEIPTAAGSTRPLGYLLEDHLVDHESIISIRRVIRHTHG